MQLFPDSSLFIQIIIFIVVWIGLKRLVFDPTRQVLLEREGRTVTRQHEAEQLVADAHNDRAEYDQAMQQLRATMAEESAAARRAARELYDRKLADATAAANRDLHRVRAALAEQMDAARQTLSAEAAMLAEEMFDRAVARPLP